MALNSIGDFEFIDILGVPPDLVKQQLQAIERPGVDGMFILQTGNRGKLFTVMTSVDAESLEDAMATFNDYVALIADDPQELVWHGLNLSGGNQLYQVFDVRPIQICLVANSAGGLADPSLAICECQWDLLPIVVPS
ncbi:MAG TPA: hypothetical protein VGG64_12645 [Pirellulales bacterium]|jgi:hypothetical protein